MVRRFISTIVGATEKIMRHTYIISDPTKSIEVNPLTSGYAEIYEKEKLRDSVWASEKYEIYTKGAPLPLKALPCRHIYIKSAFTIRVKIQSVDLFEFSDLFVDPKKPFALPPLPPTTKGLFGNVTHIYLNNQRSVPIIPLAIGKVEIFHRPSSSENWVLHSNITRNAGVPLPLTGLSSEIYIILESPNVETNLENARSFFLVKTAAALGNSQNPWPIPPSLRLA